MSKGSPYEGQRRETSLSTLALLRRLEWAGEHGACLECRACPRCAWAEEHKLQGAHGIVPQDQDLVKTHREGCALKAEIDRLERETKT